MGCPTVKIKPSSPEQGEFVIINEDDFDPSKHTAYEVAPPADTAVPAEADVPADTAVPAKPRTRKQG